MFGPIIIKPNTDPNNQLLLLASDSLVEPMLAKLAWPVYERLHSIYYGDDVYTLRSCLGVIIKKICWSVL